MKTLIIVSLLWAILFGACKGKFEGGYVVAKVVHKGVSTFCLRGTIAGRNTWQWVAVPKSDYKAADIGDWYYIK